MASRSTAVVSLLLGSMLAACGGGGGGGGDGTTLASAPPPESPSAQGPVVQTSVPTAAPAPASGGTTTPAPAPVAVAPAPSTPAPASPPPAPAPSPAPAPAYWTGSIQLGTSAAGDESPTLVRLRDGITAVAWPRSTEAGQQVIVQRVNDDGLLVGAPIEVAATSSQTYVSLAALATGGFAVAWCSFTNRGIDPNTSRPAPQADVLVRRFDANGAPVEAAQRINADSAYFCPRTLLAGLSGGGLAATWSPSTGAWWIPGFNPSRCRYRVMSASAQWGAETVVGDGSCTPAALPDGSFAVLNERPFYITTNGLFLQHVDAAGASIRSGMFIDGMPGNFPSNGPAVSGSTLTATPDGNLLAVYTANGALVARRMTVDGGTTVQPAPIVAAMSDHFFTPQAAVVSEDGSIVVRWLDSSAARLSAMIGRWSAAGTAQVTLANSTTGFSPGSLPLAASSGGRVMAAWLEPDGSGGWRVMAARR